MSDDQPKTRHPRFRVRKGREIVPEASQITERNPTPYELSQSWKTVIQSSDTDAAVLATSIIDNCLERCIIAHLEIRTPAMVAKLTGRDGALSSLYGKVYLAYAMGFNTIIRDDLNIARRVRNDFAHSPKRLTFSDSQIVNKCSSLKLLSSLNITSSDDMVRKMDLAHPLDREFHLLPISRQQFLATIWRAHTQTSDNAQVSAGYLHFDRERRRDARHR
jgi:hypothetical protein